KEILGHLIDDERIFAYRALCIARGDTRPLESFDENADMDGHDFEARTLADLLREYSVVRAATIELFASLPEEAWLRRGTVAGYTGSGRGLAFHNARDELHHHAHLSGRY